MVSTQPILSLRYFKLGKNKIAKGIKRLFYLSWEDALWDLLDKKGVPLESIILIPDFFCGDVEKNIKLHGYKTRSYKIGGNLIVDRNDFLAKIKKFDPRVIIVFHAVGITNSLFKNSSWLTKLDEKTILIEDCSQRIIDTGSIKILRKNHYLIDSLRKVVPIQGANIYAREDDLNFGQPFIFQSFFYSLKVNLLWFLMIISWTVSNNLTFSRKFSKILSLFAEKMMLKGYSLIGSQGRPARGLTIFNTLSSMIDVEKIYSLKNKQAIFYEKELSYLLRNKVNLSPQDYKNLRGYPVLLSIKYAEKALSFLRGGGLCLRFELNDSVWAKRQKIIYLPMGLQVTTDKQTEICNLIKSSVSF